MLRTLAPLRRATATTRVSEWLLPTSALLDTHSLTPSLTQNRPYSITTRRENPLIYGGVAVVVLGASAQMGIQAYQDFQANKAKQAKQAKNQQEDTTTTTESSSEGVRDQAKGGSESEKKEETGESLFSQFFSTTFYEGGFENKMTRREAALILGVRESANEKRIKDAHRRILVKNHPDRGGSAFIASKVNEAKDFLLKGKT